MGLKLNMGCGEVLILRRGWLNIDLADGPGILPLDIHGPLPFGDGEVDEIMSSHSLEHLERPVDALREWHRVLRPGGELLIAVPDGAHKREWIDIHLATHRARGCSDLEDHHVDFEHDTLRAALEAAGAWSHIDMRYDPWTDWRIPGKAWWQIVARAVK